MSLINYWTPGGGGAAALLGTGTGIPERTRHAGTGIHLSQSSLVEGTESRQSEADKNSQLRQQISQQVLPTWIWIWIWIQYPY
jgi:hypothetical protein